MTTTPTIDEQIAVQDAIIIRAEGIASCDMNNADTRAYHATQASAARATVALLRTLQELSDEMLERVARANDIGTENEHSWSHYRDDAAQVRQYREHAIERMRAALRAAITGEG